MHSSFLSTRTKAWDQRWPNDFWNWPRRASGRAMWSIGCCLMDRESFLRRCGNMKKDQAWLVIFTAFLTSSALLQAAPATGPLRISKKNPCYFADSSGRAIYLTGSHTWANLQDIGLTNPPPAFDFVVYLDFLQRHHHNFIRLWRWEFPQWNEKKNRGFFYCAPQPWARSGPGQALDGQPKFDLEKFDEAYFLHLRARTEAAAKRGIYVSIMLFEGWGLRFVPEGGRAHPFYAANNVNHTETELKDNFKGIELFT